MAVRQCLWCVAVVCGVLDAAAADPVRCRFAKPVDRGAARDEALVAVTLDSDVFAAARDGFADLRVFADTGVEAPYEIERVSEFREESVRQTHTPTVASLHEEGNSIELRLQLGKDVPPAEGLSIATPLKDYERKVRVFGSADGQEWTPLKEAVVFDYSRYMDVRSNEISLPANTARQLKVVIEDVTDERESPYLDLTRTLRGGEETQRVERTQLFRRPFRMDRITAWHHVKQQRVERQKTAAYPPVRFAAENDADKKETRIEIVTRREPLTSFTLETPSRNFHRRVTVEVRVPPPVESRPGTKREPSWLPIGDGFVSRIGLQKFAREQLAVSFPESRHETYRLVIHNEDSPPLEITGVQAEGVVYRIVFLAEKDKAYQLAYGSESIAAPRYDATTVLAALRREASPVETPLGKQTEHAGFAEPPAPLWSRLFNNWYFLGAVICLMVVVLGWTLFRASRRIAELPQDV